MFKNLNIWFVSSLLVSVGVLIPIITVFFSFFENHTGINNFFELNNVGPSYNNISKYLISATNPKNFLNHFFVKENLLKWQKKKG